MIFFLINLFILITGTFLNTCRLHFTALECPAVEMDGADAEESFACVTNDH